MSYTGSCHCGAVKFEVEGDAPTAAMSCNCSHCRRKGLLLDFVPIDQFRVTAGEEATTEWLFNKHNIEHRFCETCGCQPFATGVGPGGARMAAINLRCVPTVDLDGLTLKKVDGASF
ncbi:GFA family protein [Sphingomonas sp.]|uniref:GFA family protein n=1 Tax=Sphingomonas sp. TaxID=28214 RepID=UPI003D6CA9E8